MSLHPRLCVAARKVLGWSRADLSAKAGVSTSCLSDFEAGHRTPIPANMRSIIRVLEAAGISFLDPEVHGGAGLRWTEDAESHR